MLRWLVVLAFSLTSSLAVAQSSSFWSPPGARAALRADARAGRFARAASIVGLVSAGLLLGGSIAIAVVDDPDSERATRGVQLGLTALAPPFVAFGAYSARRATPPVGYSGRLRRLGWVAYSGAVAAGVAQWYGAFHGQQSSAALTVTQGVLAAMAVLPHAFDAYVCARHARLRSLRLGVSALGVFGRF